MLSTGLCDDDDDDDVDDDDDDGVYLHSSAVDLHHMLK